MLISKIPIWFACLVDLLQFWSCHCLFYVYSLADEVAVNIRRTKLLLLKSRERRRFTQLQLRHHGNQSVRQRQSNEDLALVTATRHSELSAALALQMLLSSSTQQHSRSSAQRSVLDQLSLVTHEFIICVIIILQ